MSHLPSAGIFTLARLPPAQWVHTMVQKIWAGSRAAGASASSSCVHFFVYLLNWLAVTAVMWPYPVGRISVLEHILTTASAWLLNDGIWKWKQASIRKHYSCLRHCYYFKATVQHLGKCALATCYLLTCQWSDQMIVAPQVCMLMWCCSQLLLNLD